MLKHVYDYSVEHHLTQDDRYKEKYVRYYVVLNNDGTLIDIEENKDKKSKSICPCYPSRQTYGNVANFIIEKGCVVFDVENKKHINYMTDIEEASKSSPEVCAIWNFLKNTESSQDSVQILKSSQELISYRVNSSYIEELDSWRNYFENKYTQYIEESLSKEKDNAKMVSAVTGNLVSPVKVAAKINVAGATTGTGDVVVCCDKDAYQSYGLVGALNGAISYDESETLKNGLEYLLKNNYNKDWNLIYWYDDSEVNTRVDIISILINSDFDLSQFEETSDDAVNDKNEKDKAMYEFLQNLFKKGELTQDASALNDVQYHMFNYKPCSGRIAFSHFRTGNFNELFDNLMTFYQDTLMLKRYQVNNEDRSAMKEAYLPIINIYSILLNTLTSNVEGNKKFELIDKEFNIHKKQALMNAIILNKQIPKDFFNRAVSKIRVNKVSDKPIPCVLYQILKLYINRSQRMKGETETIMTTLNKDNKDVSYNLGRLLCVYEKIQRTALGDVNASVTNKYYTSASKAPAYVFGQLAQKANYHLKKIENKGLVVYYKVLLQEIAAKIDSFPKTLNIFEQANFSLGYYQQEQDFYTKKNNGQSEQNKQDEEC